MTYTQVRITKEYRDKLAVLAAREHRSMARQLEVMIEERITMHPLPSPRAQTRKTPN